MTPEVGAGSDEAVVVFFSWCAAYFTISTREDDVKDDLNWSGERLLDGPEDGLRSVGSQG